MILTDLFESRDIHNRSKLDKILARCIELVQEKGMQRNDKFGRVGACIIDSRNRKIFAVTTQGTDGWIHAEHLAIKKYHKEFGKIEPGAIIVTTLSPCNREMHGRQGPSCQDLLQQVGIEKVYTGYMDPSQHSDHPFEEEVTENDDLWRNCKRLSDSFVHQH
jgi:pyrimidine deaminase RibD-like protein